MTPSDPAVATRRAGHRADLQGLRGIAVLLVVLFHAGALLPGGFIGVDVFFVLSGFLITGLLAEEAMGTDQLQLRRFIARRVHRLLPALATMLVIMLSVAAFVIPVGRHLQSTTATATAAATIHANLHLATSGGYFTAAAELNPLLHTWSLSLEEQFYLVLPAMLALALLVARRTRLTTRTVVLSVVGALFVSSAAATVVSASTSDTTGWLAGQWAFYGPHTRAWQLAAGGLLALALALRRSSQPADYPTWFKPAGLLLVLVGALVIDDATGYPTLLALLPVLGTLLVLLPGGHASGLTWPPLVWLGDRSYSWYLWHWPMLVFARWTTDASTAVLVAVAVASLLPAMASYRWVETPYRQRPATDLRSAARVATGCVVVPMLVSVLVGTAGATVLTLARETLPSVGYDEEQLPASFTATSDVAMPPIVAILGDSHAQAMVTALGPGLAEAGWTVQNRTLVGCILLLGLPPYQGGCAESRDELLAELAADPPDQAIVVGRATDVIRPTDDASHGFLLFGPDGVQPTDEAEALAAYEIGLEGTLRYLVDAGIDVVLISSVPTHDKLPTPTIVGWLRGSTVPGYLDRTAAEARNEPLLEIERRVAARVGRVEIIDPVPVLCSPALCEQVQDGVLLYRDDNHVTQVAAERFVAPIIEALRALRDEP